MAFAEVIAVVTEQCLAKEDPIKRQERRDERLLKRSDEQSVNSDQTQKVHRDAVAVGSLSSPGNDAKFNRALKDRILHRDGGRCTYMVRGRRCTERVFLEIHHIQPKAYGGGNEETNLTAHCSSHHHMIHGEFH